MADEIEQRLKNVEDFAAMIGKSLDLFKKISADDLKVESSNRETADKDLDKRVTDVEKLTKRMTDLEKKVADLEKKIPKK